MAKYNQTRSGRIIYEFLFRKQENGKYVETYHPDKIINYAKFLKALGVEIPKCISRCMAESDWCEVKYTNDGGYVKRITVYTRENLWKRLTKAGAMIDRNMVKEREAAMQEMAKRVINIYNPQGCTFNF